jgi:reductive dehalogenase
MSKFSDTVGVRRLADDSDKSARISVIEGAFEGFSQKDDAFCRSFWDRSFRSKRTEQLWDSYAKPLEAQWNRRGSGFSQRDFALRNAAWWVADLFAERKENEDRREGFLDPYSQLRPGPEERLDLGTPEQAQKHVKRAAEALGAHMVGTTGFDERWQYRSRFSRARMAEKSNDLAQDCTNVHRRAAQSDLKHVIVVGMAMDAPLLRTVPSALSESATGLGYGHDAVVLLSLAQYIKNLGYEAVPSMNDTALAIPYALKAGLGEYGRHGLVITPRHGPRVRFGKIFTDLDLAHDVPVDFGVQRFCEECRLCATACPAKAVSTTARGDAEEVHNRSNVRGVRKWSTDAEKCFQYWAASNTACSVCVRVCPYNRGGGLGDALWRRAANSPLRAWALRYDVWSGRGRRLRPDSWWAGLSENPPRKNKRATTRTKGAGAPRRSRKRG